MPQTNNSEETKFYEYFIFWLLVAILGPLIIMVLAGFFGPNSLVKWFTKNIEPYTIQYYGVMTVGLLSWAAWKFTRPPPGTHVTI